MEEINIIITKEDNSLYDYIKNCKDEKMIKYCLTLAVDLYKFCTGNYDLCGGNPSPEAYKEQIKNKSIEELFQLKAKNEKKLLEWATAFDPDQVDCGIMRGPESDLWFVEEYGPLGWITLLSHYNKVIDSLLEEKATPNNDKQISLIDAGMLMRPVRCLERINVKTIEDLRNAKLVDILSIKSLGKKSFNEIVTFIKANKTLFKGECLYKTQ